MSPIALILGAGKGVGHSVAAKLIAEGYKVAAASRNPNEATAKEIGFHPVKLDLSEPEQVPKAFADVEKTFGGFPTVVVYNAWAADFPPDPQNILPAISTAVIGKQLNVNTVSLWAAAQAAAAGWEKLDPALPKTFIYTGNILPWYNIPDLVSLGIGKAASAYLINALADTYGKRGIRFYFTYQVSEVDGGFYRGIDGSGAAIMYWNLIQRPEQSGWKVAFDKNGQDWSKKLHLN